MRFERGESSVVVFVVWKTEQLHINLYRNGKLQVETTDVLSVDSIVAACAKIQQLGSDMKNPIRKVVRDGKVAVLITEEYGSGWYTKHEDKRLLFLPELAAYIEKFRSNPQNKNRRLPSQDVQQILYNLNENPYTDEDIPYCGGAQDLCIHGVPEGSEFRIQADDGNEFIVLKSEQEWLKA
jgi:hypothetical protein